MVAVDGEADPAVLRKALLRDVQVGHDLDAREQARHQRARDGGGVEHDPVDAEADAHVGSARLEVDVGGAAADGVGDDRMDELDDRSLVRPVAQLDDLGRADGLQLVVDLLDGVPEPRDLADQGDDVLRRGHRAFHVVARRHRDVVEREHVGGVGGGYEHRALAEERDRDRLVAARLGGVDQVRRTGVDLEVVQVDEVEAVALGERVGELVRVDDPGVDQRLAKRHAVPAPLGHHALDDVALGEAEHHYHVADAALGAGALAGGRESRDWERAGRDGRGLAHPLGIGTGRARIEDSLRR
jgi:hypothetical protein